MTTPAPGDIELAHRQLDRYAEDFGALLLEYQDIKTQFAAAQSTRQQAEAQRPIVPHHSLCRDLLRQACARAREDAHGLGLLYIDLDRFKKINDSLGHTIGDRLLEAFAQRLARVVREHDTVVPFGGDEFIVIAPALVLEEGIRLVAERIIQSLADPFVIDNRELYVGASIGVALYPQHGTEPDTLLRHADTAMVAAKTSGGNSFCLFDADLGETHKNRLDLELGLRRGLAEAQFRLMYQPQVRAGDGWIIGVEALLRWDVPGQGTIMPDRFIPIAEETGLILPLGAWVLKTACAQLAAWQHDGLVLPRMAVNITARQLNDPAFVPLVDATLAENGIHPAMLELEITESQLMDRLNVGLTNLIHLRQRGVRIAVDDFGTGYSSLGRIRSLPIDCIKVDRSFIVDVDQDTDSYAIANAILCMARALKLSTIAEGIERTDQAQLLAGIHCDEFQGFLFGKPQPPEAIAAQLRQQQEDSSCSRKNC